VRQAAGKLGYLSLIVLYVVTRKPNLLATSYVYYLGRPYHRLAEMNKFCTTLCPPGENMLAIEFSCHAGDPIWRSSADELLALSMPHLVQDGVLEPAQVEKKFLVRAPNAYPIRYLGYRENLDVVRTHLEQLPGMALLGRTGEYQYIDSDQCMERAIELAERIAGVAAG
jgi:protoporphyrinogen oxidase